MTKAQIKAINELLDAKDTHGKEMLRWVLWRNTEKPKIETGHCCKITDRNVRIWGVPVKGFCAKVVRAYCYKTQAMWYYELEIIVKKGNSEYKTTLYKSEAEVWQAEVCEDNITILE